MKQEMMKFGTGLLLLIIGTVLGVLVQDWRTKSDRQVRYLERSVDVRGQILARPKIEGKKLEILLDGHSIENMSAVVVSLSNYSDRDYDNVPVLIELRSVESVPLQIISQDATGASGLRDTGEVLKDVGLAADPSAVRFSYTIKTVNRTTTGKPAFQAQYLILGAKAPEVDVRIFKPGLELRDFSFDRLHSPSWLDYLSIFAFPLGILVLYIPLLFFARKYGRKRLAEWDKKLREVLDQAIRNTKTLAETSGFESGSSETDYILAAFQRYRWEATPRWA